MNTFKSKLPKLICEKHRVREGTISHLRYSPEYVAEAGEKALALAYEKLTAVGQTPTRTRQEQVAAEHGTPAAQAAIAATTRNRNLYLSLIARGDLHVTRYARKNPLWDDEARTVAMIARRTNTGGV